uniref:PH domain-containing protein n=1 Tax=Arion vulgaris TaxID=1028688 RepID=A0A0B7AMB3_9EUPU
MSSIDCSVSAALCSTPLVLYYDKQEEAVVLFFTTSDTTQGDKNIYLFFQFTKCEFYLTVEEEVHLTEWIRAMTPIWET